MYRRYFGSGKLRGRRGVTIDHLLDNPLIWEVIPSRASVASSGCPVWGRFSSA